MTDRELLELAAKAAGYVIDHRASFKTWNDSRKLALLNPKGGRALWNADDDDGDALRLAVALKMVVQPRWSMTGKHVGWTAFPSGRGDCMAETDDPNDCKPAIVRAAAEVGKDMP